MPEQEKSYIKRQITQVAKKPKTLIISLFLLLFVITSITGCRIAGIGNQAANFSRIPEIRFEPQDVIPEAVKDYALELVEQDLTYYIEDCGYTFTDAKITALTQIGTGTAGLTKVIQMWLLEYRLLPEDRDSIILAGGMQFDDDGWLTEQSSAGQPYLLLVCYIGDNDTWQRVCVTHTDTITTEYGTPEMLEQYDNKFTAAAVELFHKIIEKEPLGDAVYSKDSIYELFDFGGSMNVGLYIQDDGAHNTYTVSDRWYAESFGALMDNYKWKILENNNSLSDLWTTVPYYVIVSSADNSARFIFFGESDFACYRSGEVTTWYETLYKYTLSEGEDDTLAAAMRSNYDGLDVSYEQIAKFFYDGTVEQTAQLFSREIYPNHLFHLVPGSKYGIMDYQVVNWGVDAVSKDETAIVGWFEYAVLPHPDNNNSHWLWAGNTVAGSGDLAGWLVMYRQFVLEKREDGYWYCTGLGTGGYTLPEKYIE